MQRPRNLSQSLIRLRANHKHLRDTIGLDSRSLSLFDMRAGLQNTHDASIGRNRTKLEGDGGRLGIGHLRSYSFQTAQRPISITGRDWKNAMRETLPAALGHKASQVPYPSSPCSY